MATNRLLHMERSHPAVIETVRRIVTGENDVPYAHVRDFDSNEYSVRVNDDATAIVVSIRSQVPRSYFDKFCAEDFAGLLGKHFGKGVAAEADEGTVVSIHVSLPTDDPAGVVNAPVLVKAASLRTILLAAPLLRAVELYKANKPFATRIPYRPNESIYLYPANNNLNAVISIRVENPSDRIMVRTFLTQFGETKRMDRGASAGPGFMFLPQAPAMPGGLSPAEPSDDEGTFWCCFTLSKKAMEKPADTELCMEFLANFRQYVMYHMQCARSAMHAKMRDRVKTSLLVLNRAKTAATGRPRISIE
jgi:actin related protein 2/3 complex subunit 2